MSRSKSRRDPRRASESHHRVAPASSRRGRAREAAAPMRARKQTSARRVARDLSRSTHTKPRMDRRRVTSSRTRSRAFATFRERSRGREVLGRSPRRILTNISTTCVYILMYISPFGSWNQVHISHLGFRLSKGTPARARGASRRRHDDAPRVAKTPKPTALRRDDRHRRGVNATRATSTIRP